MPIEVPASITSLKDLIALNLDLAQETIIDNLESPLTEVFNVVILTGEPHSSANMNMGTAYGNPTDSEGTPAAPVYFFARVRRLDVDSLEKPDPFKAATYRSRRRLTNLHPLAVAINSGGESVMPTQGDIWEARYLNRFRKGLILNKKVGRSQEYESWIISGKAEGVLQKVVASNAEGNTVADYSQSSPAPVVDLFTKPKIPSEKLSHKEKINTLHPAMRSKVEAVLEELRSLGFQPKIFFAWRSLYEQEEIFEKGKSRVMFSFHTAYKDGKPNSYAVDIIDERWAWQPTAKQNGFWVALGVAGKKQGLFWGGDWKSFKDWAHLQFYDNDKLGQIKTESGLPDSFKIRP